MSKEDDIEEAVARGVAQGVTNVVVTVAEGYLLGGCLLFLIKAAGFVLLGAILLGYLACHR